MSAEANLLVARIGHGIDDVAFVWEPLSGGERDSDWAVHS